MNLIQFKQGSTAFVMQGTGIATTFKGAILYKDPNQTNGWFANQPNDGETTTEELRVMLEGTAAAIETAIQSMARYLTEAMRVKDIPGADWVYLEVKVEGSDYTYRSKVLGGQIQMLGKGPDQRSVRSQGVKLLVKRLNYWEDNTQRDLYISSAANARTQSGVTILNKWDGANNYVQILAADAGGDLPAPVRLSFTNAGAVTASLFAGENISSDPANLAPDLEGEAGAAGAGVTLTSTSDTNSSGGAFARLAWSGSGTVTAVRLTLSSALLQDLLGMPFLPIMRLANVITAGEEFWAFWRITYTVGGSTGTLAEGRPGYLVNSQGLQPGSPLCLPPWKVESGETPLALNLDLVVQADDTGSHTLDVDHVFLMPLEDWRNYMQSASLLPGLAVYDNPYAGTIKSYGYVQGHQAEGPGLWVWPNKLQRYYFLLEGIAAGGTLPAQQSTVRMYYRPRKQSL